MQGLPPGGSPQWCFYLILAAHILHPLSSIEALGLICTSVFLHTPAKYPNTHDISLTDTPYPLHLAYTLW